MLRTLRLRLLAMILVVLAPLAVFISIGARTTYDTAVSALRASQSAVATNVGIQLRISLATGRRILTTLSSVTDLSVDDVETCNRIFSRSLTFSPGSVAIRIKRGDNMTCLAVLPDRQGETAQILGLFDQLGKDRAPNEVLPGYAGTAWFGSGRTDSGAVFLVKITEQLSSGPLVGEMAIDLARLGVAMDEFKTAQNGTIAIFGKTPAPLLVKGSEENGTDWLPTQTLDDVREGNLFEGQSRDGLKRTYILMRIADSELFFVAGFKDDEQRAIQQQFLAFLLAPFAALLILWLAYSRMIRLHVLRWTNGLAAAARQVAANEAARAPDSDAMPTELQEVGKSFNTMLDRQADRERSLEEALARNVYLSRELHHRVKNSLQIVQSYLGLAKRSESGAARRVLLITECRVNALSTAYRLALADGELKETPVDDYLESVTANISALMRSDSQTIESSFDLRLKSQIDLATPLGLIVVEIVVTLLVAHENIAISVLGQRNDEGEALLSFSTDILLSEAPMGKLLLGLIQQAEASIVDTPDPHTFIRLKLPRSQA